MFVSNRKTLGEPIFGVPKYSRSGRKLRQRERAMILASKFAIFKNKKEAVPLQLKEMPEKLLNPDMREIEDRLPQEINMMYKTVRRGIENLFLQRSNDTDDIAFELYMRLERKCVREDASVGDNAINPYHIQFVALQPTLASFWTHCLSTKIY